MGYIIGRTKVPLTLDSLLGGLTALYPQTAHTGDYFDNRIAREEQIASEIGLARDCAPLESTRDASRRLGPKPTFDVPVSSTLTFSGCLSEQAVMLHSDRVFTLHETEELRNSLESLGLELETYCELQQVTQYGRKARCVVGLRFFTTGGVENTNRKHKQHARIEHTLRTSWRL